MAIPSNDRTFWLARNVLPHEAALRAYLARWGLPADLEADDVVQEAYGVMAGIDTPADVSNPRSYLIAVARSIVLKHVRHARIVSIRPMEAGDDALAGEDPSPEASASDREQLHLLALAIAELPDPGGRIFRMRKIDGLSYREIGMQLGLSDNAVQKSMNRSMRRLLFILGRGGNGPARGPMGERRKAKQVHDG